MLNTHPPASASPSMKTQAHEVRQSHGDHIIVVAPGGERVRLDQVSVQARVRGGVGSVYYWQWTDITGEHWVTSDLT